MPARSPARRVPVARLLAAAAAALLVLSSVATVATAAPGKSFTATIAPTSLFKGGTYLNGGAGGYPSLAVTVTNTSTPDSGMIQLGSANILVPNGVTLLDPAGTAPAVVDSGQCYALSGAVAAGASACYITSTTLVDGTETTGPVLALRDLSLQTTAGSSSVTVTFPVRVGCGVDAGVRTWFMQAKQANNFSGNPGNDVTIDPPNSFPTTTVEEASCRLVFTGQPADALRNAVVTTAPFDPLGAAVAVTVATGDGSALHPVVFGNPRTITLTKASGPGGVNGTLAADTNASGVATFAPTVDAVGTYSLAASDGANVAGTTSSSFVVVDVAVACGMGASCTSGPRAATRSSVEVSTATANGGFATVAFNPSGTGNLCGSGTTGSDVFDVNITNSAANKSVNITIPKAFVTKAAKKYDVCVRLAQSFTTASGAPATPVAGGFEGNLPNCTATPPNVPCVVSRSTVQGSVEIVFLLPPGDPPAKAY